MKPDLRRSALRKLTQYLLLAVGGVALFAAALSSANAETAVGKANQIKNEVVGSSGKRKLGVSDPVFASENISAGQASHGEILLNDNSKVIVGENSQVSLDDFVVGPAGFQSATLNVAKGAFRFISGDSAKGTFKIATPLANIGVRGTIFDVYVGENGETDVVLIKGAVVVCNQAKICLLADRSCDIIEVRSANEIEEKPFLKSARRKAKEEREQFGLLFNQGRFNKPWQVALGSCNARAAQEAMESGKFEPQSGPTAEPEPVPDNRGCTSNC